MADRIQLYDTTLRDGAQSEDVSFTLDDKLQVAEMLDGCGIAYIEGGWPGSNPRDEEFFSAVKRLNLKRSLVTAFGSTRRANVAVADDLNLRQLLKADTPVVTIVGKTWDLHVRDDLKISKEQNLEVIADGVIAHHTSPALGNSHPNIVELKRIVSHIHLAVTVVGETLERQRRGACCSVTVCLVRSIKMHIEGGMICDYEPC